MLEFEARGSSTLSCNGFLAKWRRSFQVISSFLLVKSGMTVIVTRMDVVWRVVDVICVDGGARNPKTPILF